MKKFISFLTLFLVTSLLIAQTPGVKWSRLFGGADQETVGDIKQTIDGGYIVAGSSRSNNYDVTSSHGGLDIWVLKLNKFGGVDWKKAYGGSSNDDFRKLIYNPDGTTYLVGSTTSSNGDVAGYHGNTDIWVLKLDNTGNILWQKCLGGSGLDETRDALATSDNGLVITGYTNSTDGDITTANGADDIWTVKLTASGSISWQQSLGGSNNDRPRHILLMPDGNFIITGSTASNDKDMTGSHGAADNDLFVTKINPTGTTLWKKTYGGSKTEIGYHAVAATDGSIAILAVTNSTDGDVSGRSGISSALDIWIVNISYTNANINWQTIIGGTDTETPVSILQDSQGLYLVGSTTASVDGDASANHGSDDILITRLASNGTKTWSKTYGGPGIENLNSILPDNQGFIINGTADRIGGDVTAKYSQYTNDTTSDAWLVKLDFNGNIIWQKNYGGSGDDNINTLLTTASGFVFAGTSSSWDFDAPGSHGYTDYWVGELGPVNTIKGSVFLDFNSNAVKDAGEPFYSGVLVQSQSATDSISSLTVNGVFQNIVDLGTYSTSIKPPDYYLSIPASKTTNFTSYFKVDSFSFALQPIAGKQDLSVALVALRASRPGFNSSILIKYQNVGTTTINNGQLTLTKDYRVNIISSTPAFTTSSGNNYAWTLNTISPADTGSILVNFYVPAPPVLNVNDTLEFTAVIAPTAGDQNTVNNSALLKQVVVGSVDPNDKSENNGGKVSQSYISNGGWLQYTIRFQNIGTAAAGFVITRDTLSNLVDPSTLQMISASHPYTLSIENQRHLEWRFNNIQLPASSANEPASHGYLVYRVKPKTTISTGDIVHNTAAIYFDYNLPVITNDAFTQVVANLSVLPLQIIEFSGSRLSNMVNLTWEITGFDGNEQFEIQRSTNGAQFTDIIALPSTAGISKYSYKEDISSITSTDFYYRIKVINANGNFYFSRILPFHLNDSKTLLNIFPNPVVKEATIFFSSSVKVPAQLELISTSGAILSRKQIEVNKGRNVYPFIRPSSLPAGVYCIRIAIAGEMYSKFINLK
jgi:hypothetical protein